VLGADHGLIARIAANVADQMTQVVGFERTAPKLLSSP